MTQPPTYPTPPAGGQPPAGGVAPPAAPVPPGYAVPAQPGPTGYAPPGGWAPPGTWTPPGGYAPPPAGWAPPRPGHPPVPVGPGGQPLASFGDRLLAFLIDSAVAGVVGLTLFLPAMMYVWFTVFDQFTRTEPVDRLLGYHPKSFLTDLMLPLLLAELGLVVLMLGLYWLYHVEYLCRSGQTLGKKVMKLRVVPLDPTRTLDRGMAGRRYLVQFVAATVVPGFNYLDGFWQLGDKPWQQCLHDKFAATVVVKVAP
ncbi:MULTISPECIES: RDD family protein [unclassified Micromonospora]|uniref:RDD family protein n=1 Tax=unclassified Micromonospora TaxID=2617518 RepID=UPI00098D6E23|nr:MULTISPECIES: RDD family protein [unclassified Micromonospora]OON29983.1 transporter [Micromonospora sp. Rc5]